MKRTRKATPIGSISHSTMREQDLIPTFLDELEYRNKRQAAHRRGQYRDVLHIITCNEVGCRSKHHKETTEDSAQYMLDELFDDLDMYSLPYFSFGAHEGDGADYGYWPSWDSIKDDIRSGEIVEWKSGRPLPKGNHAYLIQVNDHGNTTLYTKRGREIWAVA